MKKIEKIGAKIVQDIMQTELTGWPPVCWGVIYQPERPVASAVPENDKEDIEKE